MRINRLLNGLLHRLWLVVLLAVVGGIFAIVMNKFFVTPKYEAEATLYAVNRNKTANGESISYDDIMVNRQLIKDYSEIIGSYKVISTVLRELKNPFLTEDMLDRMVSIDFKKDSSIMVVRVVSSDPKIAADVANSISRVFISKVHELTYSDNIGILDEARVPKSPMPTGGAKNVILASMAGTMLAVSIIYVIELLDSTVWSVEDIELNLNTRVLGIIPEHDIH